MPSRTTSPVTAIKSYRDGMVAIRAQLKCGGWNSDTATIAAGTDLTTEQARALAAVLIELADRADAKVAAEAASKERRKKYCDREIAAGRMVVFGANG